MAKPMDWLLGGWQINGLNNWGTGLAVHAQLPATATATVIPDSASRALSGTGTPTIPASSAAVQHIGRLPLVSNGQLISGVWQRPDKGDIWQRGAQQLVGAAIHATRSLVLQGFFIDREGTFAGSRGIVQLRESHESGPAEYLRGLPLGSASRIFNTIANYVPRQWQMAAKFAF